MLIQKEASHVSEVKAKPEYHRFLIGRGGANIRKVRDSTGARIIFPNSSDADQESITLIGKKESVEMAKAELEMLIKDLVSVKFAVHQSCKSVGAFGILGCRHCNCATVDKAVISWINFSVLFSNEC